MTDTVRAVLSSKRYAFCAASDPQTDERILLLDLASYQATDEEKRRIGDQVVKAQRLQCLDGKLLGIYIGNYYMAVVVSAVLGGIAAIALLLVGPRGWTASSPYLVNVLIISGAITAFYAGFPTLFKQADAITTLKGQFFHLEEVLDGMKTQIAEPNVVPRVCASSKAAFVDRVGDSKFSVPKFIACIDDALVTPELPFTLDPSQGPNYSSIAGDPRR